MTRPPRLPGLAALGCAAVAGGALAWASGALAASITEPQVRAFVARQEKAWNARDLTAYFALFTPDAAFVDQTRDVKHGGMIPYGRSDLNEARRQARKFLAGATSVEAGAVDRIEIAPDGRQALVVGRETTTVTAKGAVRRVCAETRQTLVLTASGLKSQGQTDTIVRCPK